MSELFDLYDEFLLEHARSPRNRCALPAPPALQAEGYNPLCGDRVHVFVEFDGDRIVRAAFTGDGCAISLAAASAMTEALKGLTRAEASGLFDRFRAMLTGGGDEGGAGGIEPETLRMFAGVSRFPMRVKCATLAWHAMKAALDGQDRVATE